MTQQEPNDAQVPEWIGRLVRLAERARGVLIAELPVMAVTAVLAGALTLAAGSMTPWPPVLCALEGFVLVERRGGAGAGALLAVADIVGSGPGAVVLVLGLLAAAPPPFVVAALFATAPLPAPPARAPPAAPPPPAPPPRHPPRPGLAALALVAGAVVLNRSWWAVLGLAVAADVLGLVALRAETRRERPSRPD